MASRSAAKLAAAAAALAVLSFLLSGNPSKASAARAQYVVLAAEGADLAEARRAIEAAGGRVEKLTRATGVFAVTAPASGFVLDVAESGAISGAARNRAIGRVPAVAPSGRPARRPDDPSEYETAADARRADGAGSRAKRDPAPGTDPLDTQLWGLDMIRAKQARDVEAGRPEVLVGVMDTGIDATHPDLAGRVDVDLSRNFTEDIPVDERGATIDGPCEYEGCVDPVTVDDNGHGTHVAGTIAADSNGLGVSGVAPKVTLVNIRVGQDYGLMFLQPVVDAITYAADNGIDVVNMSFYVDPWLFNCEANAADSPEDQLEQRTTVEMITRALEYAHERRVTLIGSLGNSHMDLGKPQPDTSSPDYPLGSQYPRMIDNASCLSLPIEGPHVIGVSSLGPSKAKSDFSNYGLEQIGVSAPGGWFRDFFGTPEFRRNENQILSTYPRNVGVADGNIDPAGDVTPDGQALGVQKACATSGECGYYRFLQGTSMAAPHAAGVAALIVSQFGGADTSAHGGRTMDPDEVEEALRETATDTPCPTPRTVEYIREGRDASYTATCEGEEDFNGFYGDGIVDALSAVTTGLPSAQGDDYEAVEDETLTVDAPGVLANDTAAHGLGAEIAVAPAHGTVDLKPDGSFTYTGARDYFGPDSFAYNAVDRGGNTSEATVTLTVAPRDEPPTPTPTASPSPSPTASPSPSPTTAPTVAPTTAPTVAPTAVPTPRRCVSRRVLTMTVRPRRGQRLVSVAARIGAKAQKTRRSGKVFKVTVDLRGRTRGSYTVRVTARTTRGRTLRSARSFGTCGAAADPSR